MDYYYYYIITFCHLSLKRCAVQGVLNASVYAFVLSLYYTVIIFICVIFSLTLCLGYGWVR